MANTFLTPQAIAAETLVRLDDSLAATQLFHRDFEPEFNGVTKVGDTIKVKRPPVVQATEFVYADGIQIQDINVSYENLTIEKHFDVSHKITTRQLPMELNDFTNDVILPAVTALSEKVEAYIQSKYVDIYNVIGQPGAPPDTLGKLMQIGANLTNWKVPLTGRIGLVDPFTAAGLGSSGDLMRADAIADGGTAIREAEIGKKGGINWYTSRMVNMHNAGTISNGAGRTAKMAATPAGSTSTTLSDTALTGTLVVGDVFTIAGVNDTRGRPLNFVVNVAAAAGSNAIAVSFKPALPIAVVANSVITVLPSHVANLVGHPFGLTYAMVTPDLPLNTGQQAASLNFRGLGIRVVYGYDMTKKDNIISFDTMVGAKAIQPELLARLLG